MFIHGIIISPSYSVLQMGVWKLIINIFAFSPPLCIRQVLNMNEKTCCYRIVPSIKVSKHMESPRENLLHHKYDKPRWSLYSPLITKNSISMLSFVCLETSWDGKIIFNSNQLATHVTNEELSPLGSCHRRLTVISQYCRKSLNSFNLI